MAQKIIGGGDYTYRVEKPFGELPDGMQLGNVSSVAVDSRDRVYVFQRKDPPVLVFDPEGNLLSAWGEDILTDAHGIHFTPEDELFLVDKDSHEVLKCTADGRVLLRLGNRDKPAFQAPFNHPADAAVSSTGDIFVSDGYGNSRVHRFSAEGEFILSWGTPGAGPTQFTTPHSVWVDKDDRVLVSDRENNRIQIFSLEGDLLGQWGDLFHPMDMFVDEQNMVYVTDQIPRLSVFTLEGELVARCLHRAHGISGDSRGNLYTAWPYPEGNPVTRLVKL